ncbi:hypothetical protein E2562_011484 [Oryza meyeriana var. granulata]|uniref:Uncharacterized protein n=1 Tax=Oryza meyeriana var. granulata TaxID=110450 RepID=A0A6G1D268_9ORYZ|nr:hypothetical protein E2562_011484 [Oryza meyeriana var. granulata]
MALTIPLTSLAARHSPPTPRYSPSPPRLDPTATVLPPSIQHRNWWLCTCDREIQLRRKGVEFYEGKKSLTMTRSPGEEGEDCSSPSSSSPCPVAHHGYWIRRWHNLSL